jgi:hypothetical protein
MSAEKQSTVVGVFNDRTDAERAVGELGRTGFGADQIGLAVREGDVKENAPVPAGESGTKMEEGATGGVLAGGAIGGLLGALAVGMVPGVGPVAAAGILAAVLGGAATGALTGGLLGALIGMGIPEEEAHRYHREFLSGRTLVTVRAGERYAEAIAILRRHGAYDTSAPSLVAGVAHLP